MSAIFVCYCSFLIFYTIHTLKKVLGIAFSSNHDGNVLFIKKDSLSQVKPLQYCVMDWQRPSDPRAFAHPWTLLGSNISATDLQGAIKDFLAAAGVPRGNNSFDEVYIYDLFNIKESAAINFVKKDSIFGGEWVRGTCKVVNLIIQDNWRGAKDIHLGFADFQAAYSWLFMAGNRITWKEDPSKGE